MIKLVNEILNYRPFTLVGLQTVCVLIDSEKRAQRKKEVFDCNNRWGLDCGLSDMIGLSMATGEISATPTHTNTGTYFVYSGSEECYGYPLDDKEANTILSYLDGYGERAILLMAEKVYSEYQKTLPNLSDIRGILKETPKEKNNVKEKSRT